MTRSRPFTLKELIAIDEALSSRTAGEIDVEGEEDMPAYEDYESAWSKIAERIAKMERA